MENCDEAGLSTRFGGRVMKIVVLAASAQSKSVNKNLAAHIATQLAGRYGSEVVLPDFKQFTMLAYDGDFEAEVGVPEGAAQLAEALQGADALVLCAPEYNGGISGALKNAIDWVSRLQPHPFARLNILLTGASPGGLGAVRGLWHTRVPLEALGAHVYPDMFGLGRATGAFGADGSLQDPGIQRQLDGILEGFVAHVKRHRNG
jgi:NAD(P)H-dependent FMN reductase